MNCFKLNVVDASPELFNKLEEMKLIKLFRPTLKALDLPENKNAVDYIYTTDEQYGSHKLICVGLNSTTVKLNYHPDNEDFILINNTGIHFKQLYLIIGLHKSDILQKKINDASLCESDIIAVRLKFNDPLLSVFTMLKNTVHCEITESGLNLRHPVFFVTEPTNLKQFFLDTGCYTFRI